MKLKLQLTDIFILQEYIKCVCRDGYTISVEIDRKTDPVSIHIMYYINKRFGCTCRRTFVVW